MHLQHCVCVRSMLYCYITGYYTYKPATPICLCCFVLRIAIYCVSSFDSSGFVLHMCVLPPVARTSAVRINVRTVVCVDIQRCVGLLCIPVDYSVSAGCTFTMCRYRTADGKYMSVGAIEPKFYRCVLELYCVCVFVRACMHVCHLCCLRTFLQCHAVRPVVLFLYGS